MNDVADHRVLGAALGDARRALGLLQTDVAKAIGAGQSAVSDIERGVSCRLPTLQRYARAVGVRLVVTLESISKEEVT